jgi:chaperone BCS1
LHVLRYKNRLLWFTRAKQSAVSASASSTSGAPPECIQISTLGRSRKILQDLVFEAQKLYIDRDQSRTVVFAAGMLH